MRPCLKKRLTESVLPAADALDVTQQCVKLGPLGSLYFGCSQQGARTRCMVTRGLERTVIWNMTIFLFSFALFMLEKYYLLLPSH